MNIIIIYNHSFVFLICTAGTPICGIEGLSCITEHSGFDIFLVFNI